MTRQALAGLLLAGLAAGGCRGGSADRWIKDRLVGTPIPVRVVQIESDRADERREALQTVVKNDAARKMPSVIRLYCLVARSDKDPMVRATAVRGLGRMAGEDVLRTLDYVAMRDANSYVRRDAVEALRHLGSPEAVTTLREVLAADADVDVRVAAAVALRDFTDPSAAKALLPGLRDGSLAVSFKAWESLRFMTGQDLPRQPEPWQEFLASSEKPLDRYGRPVPLPKGESQRPMFTKSPAQFLKDLFAEDVREAELK